ncbi:hypothetical protein BDV93DRAFT_545928 [Ceratobasidium sp. AG-I]|nr:hypothetical protein BDV93DRAFT_545928 [Ceratobasidium sp. AG-I]
MSFPSTSFESSLQALLDSLGPYGVKNDENKVQGMKKYPKHSNILGVPRPPPLPPALGNHILTSIRGAAAHALLESSVLTSASNESSKSGLEIRLASAAGINGAGADTGVAAAGGGNLVNAFATILIQRNKATGNSDGKPTIEVTIRRTNL